MKCCYSCCSRGRSREARQIYMYSGSLSVVALKLTLLKRTLLTMTVNTWRSQLILSMFAVRCYD